MATITRWDPFKDLTTIQERINRLFDENIGKVRFPDIELATGSWSPAVDIFETKDNVVLKAELPGLEKKDFSIEVKDNLLILKGERKCEKETKEENYYRMERAYGSFTRSFNLPTAVDKDRVKAKFKDGVLEVTIPKTESAKPKQISVDVE
ncbi:MAG: Hsp20/alpha crystallin family protein [Deltaproteobacteria bacterium]|nr:Hsp20/alpha crystallin family protein [Deltaproteobacteria bacterium]MCL5276372.1 Hsp20/alpha crystallin family protein [Deltaproteobacteria bacterium]